jgi:hypothetical protein
MAPQKPELYFSRAFEATWTDRRQTWQVTATLVLDEAGLRFTDLHISPPKSSRGPRPAVTRRVLQRLPLQKWVNDWAASRAKELRGISADWAKLPILQQRLEEVGKRRPRTSARAGYAEVAKVYRAALAANESPTKAVALKWGVSRTLAGSWVNRARKAGLLGATEQGRAKG